METENQQLNKANLKQAEQILILQDKLQSKPTAVSFLYSLRLPFVFAYVCIYLTVILSALLERPMSPAVDAHLVPSSPLHPPSCPGTPPAQEEGWRMTGSIANCTGTSSSSTSAWFEVLFELCGFHLYFYLFQVYLWNSLKMLLYCVKQLIYLKWLNFTLCIILKSTY